MHRCRRPFRRGCARTSCPPPPSPTSPGFVSADLVLDAPAPRPGRLFRQTRKKGGPTRPPSPALIRAAAAARFVEGMHARPALPGPPPPSPSSPGFVSADLVSDAPAPPSSLPVSSRMRPAALPLGNTVRPAALTPP
ncbi:hypothetical protein B0H14DRAFT_3535157 [Mycena olivaceomarginata]|nr:hypothetical protein B0H14DRAFT_3535157 [Mycena olivaceomarginata]